MSLEDKIAHFTRDTSQKFEHERLTMDLSSQAMLWAKSQAAIGEEWANEALQGAAPSSPASTAVQPAQVVPAPDSAV